MGLFVATGGAAAAGPVSVFTSVNGTTWSSAGLSLGPAARPGNMIAVAARKPLILGSGSSVPSIVNGSMTISQNSVVSFTQDTVIRGSLFVDGSWRVQQNVTVTVYGSVTISGTTSFAEGAQIVVHGSLVLTSGTKLNLTVTSVIASNSASVTVFVAAYGSVSGSFSSTSPIYGGPSCGISLGQVQPSYSGTSLSVTVAVLHVPNPSCPAGIGPVDGTSALSSGAIIGKKPTVCEAMSFTVLTDVGVVVGATVIGSALAVLLIVFVRRRRMMREEKMRSSLASKAASDAFRVAQPLGVVEL
jgi:hypothetical protein